MRRRHARHSAARRGSGFVKHAVERRDRRGTPTPPAIPVLWGCIILVGCAWNDLSPQTSWIFWLAAPPIGFVLSGVLGGKAALSMGEYDPADGAKQGLHWSCCFLGAIPVVILGVTGRIQGQLFGQLRSSLPASCTTSRVCISTGAGCPPVPS